MRVAIITNFFPPIQTGSCYWAKTLAEMHVRKGDNPIVITVGSGKKVVREDNLGFPVYRLPARFRLPRLNFFLNFEHFYLMDSLRNRKDTIAILKENQIDFVHQSNHLLDGIFLASHAAKKLDLPSISTIHGVIAHSGNKIYNAGMQVVDKTVLAPVMRRFGAIVSLDAENKRYVDETYGTERSVMIPLCAMDENFISSITPADFAASKPGKLRIASIGHVTENRNRMELVRAIPTLLKEGIDIELIVIGKLLCKQAQVLAEQLGVSKHVQFVGERKREDLFDLLRGMDAEAHHFFMPGLGCATLEAMAVGLPVLAYGYPGIYGDVPLEHGKNILFANPYDQASVESALRHIAHDVEVRRTLGEGARSLVLNHLTWEITLLRYRNLFAKLSQEERVTEPETSPASIPQSPSFG